MNSLATVPTEQRAECVVIDDDPDICRLISHVLSKIGVSSIALSNTEALAGALGAEHPTIVFLDVHLDRSDAIDGIRILRQESYAGAVQLISGKDTELLNDIKAIGERNGLTMLEPMQKPFRSEHLRRIFSGRGGSASPGGAPLRVVPGQKKAAVPPVARIDLAEALDSHWLDMAYQPKVDLVRGCVVGAEGLARVNHPAHGVLAPQSFLPGAPDLELKRLTEFVIRKAFLDWEVMANSGSNLRLAVNAPVKALIDPGLVTLVREYRPRDGRWPGLIIEVTEDEAVQEFDAVAEAAVQLRIYNIDLAIDDFGSGYSSFARLKQFPFSEIKLDRSFVQNCSSELLNLGICQSIVDLARHTGATCVAEGIETEADWNTLVRLGCEQGQGYLFGRPMSVGKLIERTADQSVIPD